MTDDAGHSLAKWAQDATLGIFVHWGLYSIPAWAEPTGAWGQIPPEEWFPHNAYAEWYGNTIRIPGSPAAEHHRETYGDKSYYDFLEMWDPSEYDPNEWARLFSSIGADYVLPVTKHHDGVALWDAPGEGQLSTVTSGPRRDLIGPLAEAVRAHGMRFAVYYSGGLDWSRSAFPPIQSMDDVWTLRPQDAEYTALATSHLRDLVDRYKPSLIWNDIEWPDLGKTDGSLDELIAHYREVVPDGVINDRWGPKHRDYRISEYAYDAENENGTGWEQTRGLGFSFGYNQIEDESLTITARELARVWADIVARGGRLLLNVGPQGSGRIPDIQRRTFEAFSPWMTQVKPLTADRSVVADGTVSVTSGDVDSWYRAWRSGDRIVVIAEDADLEVAAGDGTPVVVIALPQATRTAG